MNQGACHAFIVKPWKTLQLLQPSLKRILLPPNSPGYLSEAGASIVDECFELNIVPKTRIVRLTSPSFHYSHFDRARARAVQSASRRFPDTVR